MSRIDVTLRSDTGQTMTLVFPDTDSDACRERLDMLLFVLRPFVGVETSRPERTVASKGKARRAEAAVTAPLEEVTR